MAAWVYILICADKSCYVGCTTDLDQPFNQPNDGAVGGCTKARLSARGFRPS